MLSDPNSDTAYPYLIRNIPLPPIIASTWQKIFPSSQNVMYPTCQQTQKFAGILLHYCRDYVLFLNLEDFFQLSADLSSLAIDVFALMPDRPPQPKIEEAFVGARESFTNGYRLIINHQENGVDAIKLAITRHFMNCICHLLRMYEVNENITTTLNNLNSKIIALPSDLKPKPPIPIIAQGQKAELITLLEKLNQNKFPRAKGLVLKIKSSSKDFKEIDFALLQNCAGNELKQKQRHFGIMHLLEEIDKYLQQ